MRKLVTILVMFLLLVGMSIAQEFTLTILQTGDLHGNIFPIDYANGNYSDVGLGKVATIYRNALKENPATILLDTGDLIQGTPLEYYHAKIDNSLDDPMVKVMNAIGYKGFVIGNHEFNYGMSVLEKAVSEANFPTLSANIVKRGTETPYFEPYTIFRVSDGASEIKVAYLGLTTKYIPNWEEARNIAPVEFLDPVETAKKYVPQLREMSDVVIVGYHGGFEKDPETGNPTEELTEENQSYEIAMEVPGIDVLLTGHQHRIIAQMLNGIAVTQPSNWGRAVGKINIKLEMRDGKWVIVEKTPEILTTTGVEAARDILALVQSYEDKTQDWLNQPVGMAKGDFYIDDPFVARLTDNPLLEFIAKVQMKATGANISGTALFTNDIKGWKEGPVTLRDINAVYIYANTLKVLRVTGADIKAALEVSAGYFTYTDGIAEVTDRWVNPKPRHYNYDVWEGINYKIALNKPEGERIVQLNFRGNPVEMDKEYEIVMNNYRAGGGGGYSMFAGKPVVKEVMLEVSELMADYVMKNEIIEATLDNNREAGIVETHAIEWNETLAGIADTYGITVKDIVDLNPVLKEMSRIDPGTEIMIFIPYLREVPTM